MRQNASPLKTALVLRLVALLAFPAGAVLAALLERSLLTVIALAMGMLLASWVERLRLMRAAGNDEQVNLTGLLPGLAWRAGILVGMFVLSLGILALFRETVLARGLSFEDFALVAVVTGIALVANGISARIATQEISTAVAAFRSASGEGGANDNTAGGEIIEGEIVDPGVPD